MSIQCALDNIHLRPTSRWGHTEYSLGYHGAYLAKHTGLPEDDPELVRRAQDHFGFDFNWNVNDGLVDWNTNGRCTDMGHASYAVDGSDMRDAATCPFDSPEEVWPLTPSRNTACRIFKSKSRPMKRRPRTRARCGRSS